MEIYRGLKSIIIRSYVIGPNSLMMEEMTEYRWLAGWEKPRLGKCNGQTRP